MKLALKIVGVAAAVLVLLIVGAWVHLEMTWKKNYATFPTPSLTVASDSATVARGEYLANAVAHCSACHQGITSQADRSGTNLKLDYVGGHVWDVPVFGRFVAANLTSDEEAGIGRMSDGEIARVVRNGLFRNGDIAPFMSFGVGPIADEDLAAVIAYLRTVQPVKNSRPPEEYGLLAKVVLRNLNPERAPPPKWVPEGGISVERGEYLANGPAACFYCHSASDPLKGFAIEGPRFKGAGMADVDATDPAFEIQAPNLTPDPGTGHITSWTEEDFVKRFQGGVVFKGSGMPWENFARMKEDDVRSLYRYLRTLAPVKSQTGPTRRPKGSWKPSEA